MLIGLIVNYHCSLLSENISPFGSMLVAYDNRQQLLLPVIFYKSVSFLMQSFNNQLGRVCAGFAAGEAHSCTARGSQGNINRAVSGHQGRNINGRPDAATEPV
jgi:hypothetical protein